MTWRRMRAQAGTRVVWFLAPAKMLFQNRISSRQGVKFLGSNRSRKRLRSTLALLRLCGKTIFSEFNFFPPRPNSTLAKRRRGVAEGRGGEVFGPDQLLLALEPLLNEDFDFSRAV